MNATRTGTARLKILLAENGTIVMLVLLVAVIAALNPRFLQPTNLLTVVQSVAEIGVVALPLAFLIMSGSIDLSVGSVASLAGVVSAMTTQATGNVWAGFAAALVAGLIAGAVNGLLVEYLGLNPLVVTLGFLNVWAGVALFLANGRTLTDFPPASADIGRFSLFGVVPLSLLILSIAAVGAWALLNRRPFGRHVLAIGGNARAAYLMGIRVRGVRMRLFLLSGACAALAGILLSTKLQAAAPTLGAGLEFTALTVVLLGGIAFDGGHGRISGVVAGLLFVGVLRNGLVMLGVSQFLQTVVIGATLVVAVSFDRTIQRVLSRAWTNLAQNRTPPLDAPVAADAR